MNETGRKALLGSAAALLVGGYLLAFLGYPSPFPSLRRWSSAQGAVDPGAELVDTGTL